MGYQVTAKTRSPEALDLFKKNPFSFDLVITDMTMPHMTGSQLSKEILVIRNDIPIILCTGFSDIIDKHKAENIGIKDFLMKPIDRKTLTDTVRKVLDEDQTR